MEQQLPIPLSIKVSRETLLRVFQENPILKQTLEATLKNMEPEITHFVESTITPNALLMEKNIPDYSYNTDYGLDTVIISVEMYAAKKGMTACLESGDLTKMADFIAAEISEARVRVIMEEMRSTIKWMAKQTKKIGKKMKNS